MRICQEFYCAKSGGGCGGYIMLRLSDGLNGNICVICPKCDHHHERVVKNGRIIEEGRGSGGEEIVSTMSAYSVEPRAQHDSSRERDAAIIPDESSGAKAILRESWVDRFAGRLTGRRAAS